MCRSDGAGDLSKLKESFSLLEHVSMSRHRESPTTEVGLNLPLKKKKSTVLPHKQLKYLGISPATCTLQHGIFLICNYRI